MTMKSSQKDYDKRGTILIIAPFVSIILIILSYAIFSSISSTLDIRVSVVGSVKYALGTLGILALISILICIPLGIVYLCKKSNSSNQKNQRPTLITFFCILGFVGIPLTLLSMAIPEIRTAMIQEYGNLSMVNLILSAILRTIGLVGLWRMRKWGVYFYTAMVIFSTLFSIYQGMPFDIGYIIPPVVAVISWMNLKKMQ